MVIQKVSSDFDLKSENDLSRSYHAINLIIIIYLNVTFALCSSLFTQINGEKLEISLVCNWTTQFWSFIAADLHFLKEMKIFFFTRLKIHIKSYQDQGTFHFVIKKKLRLLKKIFMHPQDL